VFFSIEHWRAAFPSPSPLPHHSIFIFLLQCWACSRSCSNKSLLIHHSPVQHSHQSTFTTQHSATSTKMNTASATTKQINHDASAASSSPSIIDTIGTATAQHSFAHVMDATHTHADSAAMRASAVSNSDDGIMQSAVASSSPSCVMASGSSSCHHPPSSSSSKLDLTSSAALTVSLSVSSNHSSKLSALTLTHASETDSNSEASHAARPPPTPPPQQTRSARGAAEGKRKGKDRATRTGKMRRQQSRQKGKQTMVEEGNQDNGEKIRSAASSSYSSLSIAQRFHHDGIHSIFRYLTLRELNRAAQTCKQWLNAAMNPSFHLLSAVDVNVKTENVRTLIASRLRHLISKLTMTEWLTPISALRGLHAFEHLPEFVVWIGIPSETNSKSSNSPASNTQEAHHRCVRIGPPSGRKRPK